MRRSAALSQAAFFVYIGGIKKGFQNDWPNPPDRRHGWHLRALCFYRALLHKSGEGRSSPFPFPQTPLAYRFRDKYTKCGVAVQHRDADLDFRDLSFEVPRHERLAE
jgi:hypothetical protein